LTYKLHQCIRNNNQHCLHDFYGLGLLNKLTEDKKREIINKVIGGETSLSLFIKTQKDNQIINWEMLDILLPYANEQTIQSMQIALTDPGRIIPDQVHKINLALHRRMQGQVGGRRSDLQDAVATDNEINFNILWDRMSEEERAREVNAVTAGGKTALSLVIKTQDESIGFFGTKPKICNSKINHYMLDTMYPYATVETVQTMLNAQEDCRTRGQGGGFLGFSNNDKLRMMIRTRPGINIKDICEQTLLNLSTLGFGSVYSLSDEDDTALKQFEFVLSQNRSIKQHITTNSMSNKKREEIIDAFRAHIMTRIDPTSQT